MVPIKEPPKVVPLNTAFGSAKNQWKNEKKGHGKVPPQEFCIGRLEVLRQVQVQELNWDAEGSWKDATSKKVRKIDARNRYKNRDTYNQNSVSRYKAYI